MHADANRDRTLTYAQIAKTIVEEAIATDVSDTALHGESVAMSCRS